VKKEAIDYWAKQAKILSWHVKPKKTFRLSNNKNWFPDGLINVSYNCLDKNIKKYKNKVAIHFYDKNKNYFSATYGELLNYTCNLCNFLKSRYKIKKLLKFKVIIYSSASLETAIAMLACSRMGVHFSVVFEDLSFDAVAQRARLLNADLFIVRGKNTNEIDKFVKKKIFAKKNIINLSSLKFIGGLANFDYEHNNFSKKFSPNNVKSFKNLFTLFTSGSTGAPKGITHDNGGYLLYAKLTSLKKFGLTSSKTILTASDAGWINGHTYALFGPLSIGATTVILEKPYFTLDQPFLQKILLECKISILYLPVTIIRLMKSTFKNKIFSKKLITLGSMGEPLAYSVGKWFANFFNLKNKSIINTYFQTETGGIICSASYKDSSTKYDHGSCGSPLTKFLGFYLDEKIIPAEFKIRHLWPGCMNSVINSKKIYQSYWDKDSNFKLFDTGNISKKGIIVHGRVDDVINIRGHRIGSGEVEAILLKLPFIKECCAVSINDKFEGSKFIIFIVKKKKVQNYEKYINGRLINFFGNFAVPEKIFILTELPKTKSGKILRRLLREVYINKKKYNKADYSTILNSKVITEIRNKLNEK